MIYMQLVAAFAICLLLAKKLTIIEEKITYIS